MSHVFQVGILGATGAVGQKFTRLLNQHPWFTIKKMGASERSAGKPYKKAVHWIEDVPLQNEVADLIVTTCEPEHFEGVDFVFSGLDSSVALETEQAFARAGIPVISNAKNHRMFDQVPLLVPEVNPKHTAQIEKQNFHPEGKGWIVTNPNCVCVPLAMALRPLYDTFGVERVIMTSLQAVSGSGYPGVPSLDILGNVLPHIGGEEDKIVTEPNKLLGKLADDGSIKQAEIQIDATATRVPTIDGHLLTVFAELENEAASQSALEQAFDHWENPIAKYDLPSAPAEPIHVHQDSMHPQPRIDAWRDKGMQLGIGRLEHINSKKVRFVALAHNTVRGAAGGAILNAELLAEQGYFKS